MGQVVKKKKKKKGRPAKADPKQTERDLRRSHRHRSVKYVFDLDYYFDEDELFADEDDQRRREKKLKHLFKLQSGGEPEPTNRRVQQASCSSDEEPSKQKIGEEMDEDVDDRNVRPMGRIRYPTGRFTFKSDANTSGGTTTGEERATGNGESCR